jgi:hypothetical protein
MADPGRRFANCGFARRCRTYPLARAGMPSRRGPVKHPPRAAWPRQNGCVASLRARRSKPTFAPRGAFAVEEAAWCAFYWPAAEQGRQGACEETSSRCEDDWNAGRWSCGGGERATQKKAMSRTITRCSAGAAGSAALRVVCPAGPAVVDSLRTSWREWAEPFPRPAVVRLARPTLQRSVVGRRWLRCEMTAVP